jgi:hypothetical protein
MLSFIGAASQGHDVFGPCFCIAVGGLIVYLKREKEEINNATPIVLPNEVAVKNNSQETPVGVIEENKPLSYEQKEAAICLVAFFAGYNGDLSINRPAYMLGYQSAVFFGIDDYNEALTKALPKYQDADKLIDTIITIKDRKAKEFLLLTCYDLTKMSKNPEAYDLLVNIANDIGYNREKFIQLINQYSSETGQL